MDLIEVSKERAVGTMEFFLRNFAHVPDDRLAWTPVPTAKSAIRIAAHTALYAARFAKMIRYRQVPAPENIEQWLAERDAEEVAVKTREEVERAFRTGTEELLAALDSLSAEDLNLTLDSGQGFSMPMKQMIGLPAFHNTLHAGQIDFLQTCWDDQQVYVG